MSSNDKSENVTTATEMLGRSGGSEKKNAVGGAISAMQGQLGNDELLARITAGNGSRDDLLEFLAKRLSEMQTAQLAELDLAKTTENSLRTTLSESESQSEKPDPTRWHQAARLYQDAARALCAGHLNRGAALLEQATTEDRAAFERMSKFVKTEANAEFQSPNTDVGADATCTATTDAGSADVADEILNVNLSGNQNLKGTRRELDPWWTDLEEEEEEEESSV